MDEEMYRQGRRDEKVFIAQIKAGNYGYVDGRRFRLKFENPIGISTFGLSLLNWLKEKSRIAKTIIKFCIEDKLYAIDKHYHYDIQLMAKSYNDDDPPRYLHRHQIFFIDIKNVRENNILGGNYTINTTVRDYISDSVDAMFIAFRLNMYINGKRKPLNSFIVVKAQEIFKKNNENYICQADIGGETCYSIAKIWNNCNTKFYVGDLNEVKTYLKSHGISVKNGSNGKIK